MRPPYCLIPLALALLIAASQHPVAAQQSDRRSSQEAGAAPQEPIFLKPPPLVLLQRGLQPLASSLPDTRVREGLMPPDASQGLFDKQSTGLGNFRGKDWTPLEYHWLANCNRYRPLYFEDAMLERHGQTRGELIQPFVSGTRFFLTFPALPYAVVVDPPRPAQSVLGHFRPGSATPFLLQRPPLQTDAGLFEAGMVVGLIFLVP